MKFCLPRYVGGLSRLRLQAYSRFLDQKEHHLKTINERLGDRKRKDEPKTINGHTTKDATSKKRSRSPDLQQGSTARPSKALKQDRAPRSRNESPKPSLEKPSDDARPKQAQRLKGKPERKGATRVPTRRSPPPVPKARTPSPSSAADLNQAAPAEAPRPRKRPGAGARLSQADKDAIKARQAAKEAEQAAEAARIVSVRGVHDVVRQHYNAVPQRGRDWRRTDSRIKGLRSFNNWVKSCLIQKLAPSEEFLAECDTPEAARRWRGDKLKVLDIGVGKGGDLGKWDKSSQPVELYIGVDPADVSIGQARERHLEMRRGTRRTFHGEFFTKDAYGEWIGDIPIIQQVGIDPSYGPNGTGGGYSRWSGGGGFDVVTMMFCMHYAFESEAKARGMLNNVAASLKKGGRFMGVIPNSDVLRERVIAWHQQRKEKEGSEETKETKKTEDDDDETFTPSDPNTESQNVRLPINADSETPEWGNSIYRVRFPGATPPDGVFRPPYGWKYSYFLEEAVEEVPEYVVPWEAFRALAEDYNLSQTYRKPFPAVWAEEKNDPVLGPLSERMGVREKGGGGLLVSEEEMDAAGKILN